MKSGHMRHTWLNNLYENYKKENLISRLIPTHVYSLKDEHKIHLYDVLHKFVV